ncbi:hypothetical protein FRC18_010182 [Serendipita sp. 400]|nr:hypothetical protein FRC18_010182 [Serendipita sp. 400]
MSSVLKERPVFMKVQFRGEEVLVYYGESLQDVQDQIKEHFHLPEESHVILGIEEIRRGRPHFLTITKKLWDNVWQAPDIQKRIVAKIKSEKGHVAHEELDHKMSHMGKVSDVEVSGFSALIAELTRLAAYIERTTLFSFTIPQLTMVDKAPHPVSHEEIPGSDEHSEAASALTETKAEVRLRRSNARSHISRRSGLVDPSGVDIK